MNEESLFAVAVRMPTAAERRVFLARACGDDVALADRVARLLAADEQDRGILDRGPDSAGPGRVESADPPGPALVAGQVFADRFVLRRKLGEGGMGEVWVADQTEPVQRRVALKVIRHGLDPARLLARFDQERQALALMDHPNIARVLDAGVWGGAPFFAMELVEGVPITQYCDDRKLTPRQRLELFVPVCEAVQHAHQKGIIHRDVKPSNVLVAEYDGRPVPKVIDFGVAKAVGTKLIDDTLHTGLGAVVGTLEYMAPEQATFDARDVDTRADVYALGVLLYELLTGGPPVRRSEFGADGVLEMLRVIREVEPPRPSRRLAAADDRSDLAAARGTDPRRLTALLRGELDWVVMKALEKDRGRRYGTASGLARDVQRYLADDVVEARPPSTGYRVRKFVRRNTAALATVAAFVLIVFAGAVVSAWQAVRARQAEAAAQANERQALADRDAKEVARREEAAARTRAVAEQGRANDEAHHARAIAEFIEEDLLGQANLRHQTGGPRNRNITVRQALDRAAERVAEKFQSQPRTEAGVRLALGRAYHALGEYDEAQKHLDRSWALRARLLGEDDPATLDVLHQIAWLQLSRGNYSESKRLNQLVLDRQTARLGPDHEATLASAHNLALAHHQLAEYDEADRLFQRVMDSLRSRPGGAELATLNSIAVLNLSRGRFAAAEYPLQELLRRCKETHGADDPLTLVVTNNLASCYLELGRPDEAEPLYRTVWETRRRQAGPDDPATLSSLNFLGLALQARGKLKEAEATLREVLELRSRKLTPDHPDVLTSVSNFGLALKDRGKLEEAERYLKKALDGRRAKLGDTDPDTLRSLSNLAGLYRQTGQDAEVEPLLTEAVTGAKKRLTLGHPQTQRYVDQLADLHRHQGRPGASEANLREVAEYVRKRLGRETPAYAGRLAELTRNLLLQGKYQEAEPVARECLAIRTAKEQDVWTTFDTRSQLGESLLGQKQYETAEPLLVAGYEGMKARDKTITPQGSTRIPEALDRLIELYTATDKPDAVTKWRAERAKYPPDQAPPPRPVE